MAKRKLSGKWRVTVVILIVIAIYLNRSYAYFFDYIESHKITPMSSHTNLKLQSRTPNPQTKLTYTALGDSLTYGVGVREENQTFPYLVAQFLTKSADVELINLGIPGTKTGEVIELELPKLKTLKPDLITLLIGTNDAQTFETENTFKINYQTILNQITVEPKTKVVILNIPSLKYNFFPPYKYLMDLRIRRFNSIIDNLVAEKKQSFENIIFINLYDRTKQKFMEDPTLYSPDNFHPGAKGYKLWSEIINANLNF